MQRFRGGLVFKAHRLCVSLNSRLESNKEEERVHRVAALAQSRGRDIYAWHMSPQVADSHAEGIYTPVSRPSRSGGAEGAGLAGGERSMSAYIYIYII